MGERERVGKVGIGGMWGRGIGKRGMGKGSSIVVPLSQNVTDFVAMPATCLYAELVNFVFTISHPPEVREGVGTDQAL